MKEETINLFDFDSKVSLLLKVDGFKPSLLELNLQKRLTASEETSKMRWRNVVRIKGE